MKLTDIYDQLAYGELRQVVLGSGSLSSTSDDGMPKESYKKVLPLVKLGLTELHKRFKLREEECTVTLVDGTLVYPLSDYVAEDSELMNVDRVFGVLDGEEYEIPLNKIGNKEAIRTMTYNVLTIPDDATEALWLAETTELRVVYQADHPTINTAIANAAPNITDIYLPTTFLEALTFYVAWRSMNPNGVLGEGFHEGNNYKQMFEAAVAALEDQSFDVEEEEESTKLRDRGFV